MPPTSSTTTMMLITLAVVTACDTGSGPLELQEYGPDLVANGVPDGDGHPNAGVIFYDRNRDGMVQTLQEGGCSGSLIAPRVFLTAGHCIPQGPDPHPMFVSFDAELPFVGFPSAIAVESSARHPDFLACPLVSEIPTPPSFSVGCDIGVLVLTRAPAGIEPVRLPDRGFLDELIADAVDDDDEDDDEDDAGLDALRFRIVGYGLDVNAHPGSVCFPTPIGTFCADGKRRTAPSGFFSLDEAGLGLDEDPAKGFGAGCFVDSGAPIFLGESDLVVAVHSRNLNGPQCRLRGQNTRLDTRSALQFLAPFLGDDDDDADDADDGEDDDDDDDDGNVG